MRRWVPKQARPSEVVLARRTAVVLLVAIALLAVAALVWRLSDVLLLAFGSVLVATILHAIGDPIARRTPLTPGWALVLAGLIVLAVIGGTMWLFASQVGAQISGALSQAQDAIPTIGKAIGIESLSEYLSQAMRQSAERDVGRLDHGPVHDRTRRAEVAPVRPVEVVTADV